MLKPYTQNIAVDSFKELVAVKHLGLQQYPQVLQQLKLFTHQRTTTTHDQIWFLEHAPVYTQGQAGKAEHILDPGAIPVVQSDRGGQVTYHGPGQLIVYFLADLQRKQINIRGFVDIIEQSIIELLAHYKINAIANRTAPGVYIDQAKICSLGLRVRHGRAYHGLSLNVAMDLEPFTRINPCGFAGMQVVQMRHYVPDITVAEVTNRLTPILLNRIGYVGEA